MKAATRVAKKKAAEPDELHPPYHTVALSTVTLCVRAPARRHASALFLPAAACAAWGSEQRQHSTQQRPRPREAAIAMPCQAAGPHAANGGGIGPDARVHGPFVSAAPGSIPRTPQKQHQTHARRSPLPCRAALHCRSLEWGRGLVGGRREGVVCSSSKCQIRIRRHGAEART